MEAVLIFHTLGSGERGTNEEKQADDGQPDNNPREEEHILGKDEGRVWLDPKRKVASDIF